MLIDINLPVGNPHKHLLALPEAERQTELAYVTVGMIDSFHSIPMPGIPMEFHSMLMLIETDEFQKKKSEVKERYYRKQYAKPEIAEYVKQRDRIMSDNLSNLLWLRDCLLHIPEQDFPNRRKVKDAIDSFYGLKFF